MQKTDPTALWRPSATHNTLQLRAKLLGDIRDFFQKRDIMEVETPLLCQHTVTDPAIDSFSVNTDHQRFLQSSPEYAMKRLLASGSGSIYQICKAFRYEMPTKQHNPEFTLLEWYKTECDDAALRDEVNALLQYCIDAPPAITHTYSDVFKKILALDPLEASTNELRALIEHKAPGEYSEALLGGSKDDLLSLAFSHWIEPTLNPAIPCFITDYPRCQAALARLNPNNPAVACRFELYFQGMELANGFWELTDPAEQQQRFEKNQAIRAQLCKTHYDIDAHFISALQAGLPNCSGVALGIDRLLLCAHPKDSQLSEMLSFDWQRA